MSTVNASAKIISRLTSVVRQRKAVAVAAGVLAWLAVACAAAIAVAAIEAVGSFGPPVRTMLWATMFGLPTATAAFIAVRLWRQSGDAGATAIQIEHRYPEFRERLIAGVDFTSGPIHGSRSLAEAVVEEASDLLDDMDLGPLVDRRPLTRAVGALLAAMGIAGLSFAAFDGTLLPALARVMNPGQTFAPTARVALSVHPGDTRIARGDTLPVSIHADGDVPRRAIVSYRASENASWRRQSVALTDSGRGMWSWPLMREDATYRVEAGDAASPAYRVHVVERPRVSRFRAEIGYPGYTGRPREALPENEGNMAAVLGSRATLAVEANKDIATALVVFGSGDTVSLDVDGRRAGGRIGITSTDTYQMHLRDEHGFANIGPIEYRMEALPDEYPTLRVIEPDRETDLGQDMTVAVHAEALDDFGFNRLELHFRGPGGLAGVQPMSLRTIGPGHAESRFAWDIGDMDLLPEDRVFFRVVVWDSDRVSGPKRVESEEYTLRFPSAMEIFADARAAQEAQLGGLAEVRREGRELLERVDALRRELLKTEDLSWESRREAASLAGQQESMNRQVEQMADALQETIEKLDRHDVISTETTRKMMEIRELMADIVPPEIREALRNMQENAASMVDPERMRQALEELAEQREQLDQNLDRVLDLLREAQAEQELDAMQRRLEELARMQEDVAEQAPDGDTRRLATRERSLANQTEDARERIKDMAESMSDLADSPSEDLSRIADELGEKNVANRQESLARSFATGRRSPGQVAEAQRLTEDLQHAAGEMARVAEERSEARKRDIGEKIARAARDLLRVSMMQEELRSEVDQNGAADRLSEVGESQVDLRHGTSGVIARVLDTARETFVIPREALQSLGETLDAMDSATAELERHSAGSARESQRTAMDALNRTVDMLSRASDDARQSGTGTGLEQLLQQLSEMAQQQQQLNDAMQNMPGGGSPSPGQMDLLAQMAAQQQALAQAMQSMSEQAAQYRQILGRLGDLAGEMEDAARDIAGGRLGPRMQDRQRRILRRLLDAQRSLNLGRAGTERTAESARERFSTTRPGELPSDLGERRSRLREAMIEALRADYPPEYRRWIRSYYESLIGEKAIENTESPERR